MRGVGEPSGPSDPSTRPSLRDVFDAEVAFVFRVLRRLGVPERDLDDAAQDVFVVVHRRLPSFEPGLSLRAWLFGIIRRVALGRRRRASQRLEELGTEADSVASAPCKEEQLAARALLERALAVLDAPKREVLFLYELEGMPMHEVAEAVGCPLQTAYSRLRAARSLVRGELDHLLQRKTS
jgi:RNA polymerase sigma-70 factor, ECF subfamily